MFASIDKRFLHAAHALSYQPVRLYVVYNPITLMYSAMYSAGCQPSAVDSPLCSPEFKVVSAVVRTYEYIDIILQSLECAKPEQELWLAVAEHVPNRNAPRGLLEGYGSAAFLLGSKTFANVFDLVHTAAITGCGLSEDVNLLIGKVWMLSTPLVGTVPPI